MKRETMMLLGLGGIVLAWLMSRKDAQAADLPGPASTTYLPYQTPVVQTPDPNNGVLAQLINGMNYLIGLASDTVGGVTDPNYGAGQVTGLPPADGGPGPVSGCQGSGCAGQIEPPASGVRYAQPPTGAERVTAARLRTTPLPTGLSGAQQNAAYQARSTKADWSYAEDGTYVNASGTVITAEERARLHDAWKATPDGQAYVLRWGDPHQGSW